MSDARTPLPPSARPGASAADSAAIWAVITGMYEAYEAGDRAAIDRRLDPEATVWDSAAEPLLCGKADLDRIRDERPATGEGAEGPEEAGLHADEPVVDVFGDLAVLRYLLRVDFAPAGDGRALLPELVRNTAVLHRGADGVWRIVHLHEDVRQAGGTPGTPDA
ncbi:YybH family protein [Streptomyces sp. NPDC056169]|uniref:YybH family protein n=1 Tax=Streptomyces sp. NPDC056169 TaxID=3345734 RepID=UPI0035DE307D